VCCDFDFLLQPTTTLTVIPHKNTTTYRHLCLTTNYSVYQKPTVEFHSNYSRQVLSVVLLFQSLFQPSYFYQPHFSGSLINLPSIHFRSSLTTSHHSPSKANIHPLSLPASNYQPRPTSHIFLGTARLKFCHYARSLRFCSFINRSMPQCIQISCFRRPSFSYR
jgi:hypothetical protein